jgi:hypothetical protein
VTLSCTFPELPAVKVIALVPCPLVMVPLAIDQLNVAFALPGTLAPAAPFGQTLPGVVSDVTGGLQTVTFAEALLFDGVGSDVDEVVLAATVVVPAEVPDVTLIVALIVAVLASVATLQVTVVALVTEQAPVTPVTVPFVTVTVVITPEAESGPLLVVVSATVNAVLVASALELGVMVVARSALSAFA